MKGRLLEDKIENFKPFKIELEIESVGEARLLWHVFNYVDLVELIKSSNYIISNYKQPLKEDLCDSEIRSLIGDALNKQGYGI